MPTPDLTEFEELSNRGTQRRPCGVAQGRAQLTSEEDRQSLDAALLAVERITVGGVQKWFERRDVEVSVPAITNHRRRKCLCHA